MKLKEEIEYRKTIIVSLTLFIVTGFIASSTSMLESFEKSFMARASGGQSEILQALAKGLSFAGSAVGYTILGIILLLYYMKRDKMIYFKLYAVSALATSGINQVLKRFYRRERPLEFAIAEASGFSFPSGHSMAAAGIYFVIAVMMAKERPKQRHIIYASCMLIVLGIGWSRIYLGVHWPTDIVGGYLGGILSGAVIMNIEFEKK